MSEYLVNEVCRRGQGSSPSEKNAVSSLRQRFGRRLRAWRLSRDFGIKTVAKRVGVSVATVSGWETGRRFPTPENLDLLCQLTGLAPCQMFCEMEPMCRTRCFFFSELLQGEHAPDEASPTPGHRRTEVFPVPIAGDSSHLGSMPAATPSSSASVFGVEEPSDGFRPLSVKRA